MAQHVMDLISNGLIRIHAAGNLWLVQMPHLAVKMQDIHGVSKLMVIFVFSLSETLFLFIFADIYPSKDTLRLIFFEIDNLKCSFIPY